LIFNESHLGKVLEEKKKKRQKGGDGWEICRAWERLACRGCTQPERPGGSEGDANEGPFGPEEALTRLTELAEEHQDVIARTRRSCSTQGDSEGKGKLGEISRKTIGREGAIYLLANCEEIWVTS